MQASSFDTDAGLAVRPRPNLKVRQKDKRKQDRELSECKSDQ